MNQERCLVSDTQARPLDVRGHLLSQKAMWDAPS